MTRIDLDDLPPKVAALFTQVGPGEQVLLVQNGVVVARLMGVEAAAPAGGPEPDVAPEERAKEIFELFRSSVEDEF